MGKSLGRGLTSILEDNNSTAINDVNFISKNINNELGSLIKKIKLKTGLNISKTNDSIRIFVTSQKDLQKIKKIFQI